MARSVVHLLKEARKAIDIKDYAAALKHCKEALETDPKNYNALIFAGVSYANLTPPQPQKSEQAYKDAVTIDSNNPLAWQGLADLYSKTGEWRQLVEVCHRVLQLLGPEHPKARSYEVKLAHAQHQAGQFDDAKQSYRTLIARESSPIVTLALHTALAAVLESEEQHHTQLLLRDLAAQRQLQLPPTIDDISRVTASSNSALYALRIDVERRILATHAEIDEEYETLLRLSQSCVTSELFPLSSSTASSPLPPSASSASPRDLIAIYSVKLLQRLHRRLQYLAESEAQQILQRLRALTTHLMTQWPTVSPHVFVSALELLHRDDAELSWPLITEWALRGVHQYPHHSLLWTYLAVCWVHLLLPRPAVLRSGRRSTASMMPLLSQQDFFFDLSQSLSPSLLHQAFCVLTSVSSTSLPLAGLYALARLHLHNGLAGSAFDVAKQGLEMWKNNPPEHAAALHAYWRALHLVLASALYHLRRCTAALQTCEQVLAVSANDLEALLISAEIHFYSHNYRQSNELYLKVKTQRGEETMAACGYQAEAAWIRGRYAWLEALETVRRLERGYMQLIRQGADRLVILPESRDSTATNSLREELLRRFDLMLTKEELFSLDGVLQTLEEVTVALERTAESKDLTNGLERDSSRLLEVLVLRSRLLWVLQRHALAKTLLMRAVRLGKSVEKSFFSVNVAESVARAWCLLGQWYWYHGREQERDWQAHAEKCWLESLNLYPGSDVAGDYVAGLLFVRCCLETDFTAGYDRVQNFLNELHQQRRVVWPLFPLALLYLKRGTSDHNTAAVKALQHYLRVYNNDRRAWLTLVEAYRRQGQYTAALRVAHRLCQLEQNSSSASSYEVYYHIAHINAKLGLWAEAHDAYERCLQLLSVPLKECELDAVAASYRTLALWGLSTVRLKLIQSAYRCGQMTSAWSLLLDTENLLLPHVTSSSRTTFWKLLGDVYLHYFLFRMWLPTNVNVPPTTLQQARHSHWQFVHSKLCDGMRAYLKALQHARGQPTLHYDVAIACVYVAQLLTLREEVEDDNTARQHTQQQRVKYLQEALVHCHNALLLRPTSATLRIKVWSLKGYIHALLRQFALAHHSFVASHRVLPTRAAPMRHMAALLWHHHAPTAVIEQLLRHALSLEPTDACSWLALAIILETSAVSTSLPLTSPSTPFSLYALYFSAYDLDSTLSEAVEGLARLTFVHYECCDIQRRLRTADTTAAKSGVVPWDRRILLGLIHLTQREPMRTEGLLLLGLWYAREAQLQALRQTRTNAFATPARNKTLQLAIDILERALSCTDGEKKELQSRWRTVLHVNLAHARTLLALGSSEHASTVQALQQWQAFRPVTAHHRLRTSLGLAVTHFVARHFSEAAGALRTLATDPEANRLCVDLLVLCPLWQAKVTYFAPNKSFGALRATLAQAAASIDKVQPHVVHTFHAYNVLFGILFDNENCVTEALSNLRDSARTIHPAVEWTLLPEVLTAHDKWRRALITSDSRRVTQLNSAKLSLLQALHNTVPPLPHPLWYLLCSFLTHTSSLLPPDPQPSSESTHAASKLLDVVVALLVDPHTRNPFVHDTSTLLCLIQALQHLGLTEEAHNKAALLVHEYPLGVDGWWLLAVSFFAVTLTTATKTTTPRERYQKWEAASHILSKVIVVFQHLQLDPSHAFFVNVTLLRALSLLMLGEGKPIAESLHILDELRLSLEAKNPDVLHASVLHFLALAYWARSRADVTSVFALLRQSLLEAPLSPQTWITLTFVYTECGKFAAAERCYEQCIDLLHNAQKEQNVSHLVPTVLVQYALFAYRTSQFAKSLKLAERALAVTKHPSLWVLIFLCASALGRKNKVSQAREALTKIHPSPFIESLL
jgi:tetratricopeptide (TPR) repeat protein